MQHPQGMRLSINVEAKTVDAAVAAIATAASDGFASAWIFNIFGLDAITTIAVAGRATPGITLGTAVVPTYPRHPFALAQQAATAWDATSGRFVLGIGTSHRIVIEDMLGLSFDRPASHMREYVSVLLPLLRSGEVSFEGDYYRVHATLDRPMPDGSPPVLIAALGPAMLQLAGEVADGTILWMCGPTSIGDHIGPRLNAAAERAGRPAPMVQAGLPIAVTNTVDEARADAARIFSAYGQLPSYRAMLDHEGVAGPGDIAVVGDEESVRTQLKTFAAAGVTDLCATCFGDAPTVARTVALLRELQGSL